MVKKYMTKEPKKMMPKTIEKGAALPECRVCGHMTLVRKAGVWFTCYKCNAVGEITDEAKQEPTVGDLLYYLFQE